MPVEWAGGENIAAGGGGRGDGGDDVAALRGVGNDDVFSAFGNGLCPPANGNRTRCEMLIIYL